MRCGREQRRLRGFGQQIFNIRLRLEACIRVRACQVRESLDYALARLAVRHYGSQLKPRMAGNQAQQLACNIAGPTQDDRRNARRHCGAFTPIASMTRSPRAAPFVMALNAETPNCSVMTSTPT